MNSSKRPPIALYLKIYDENIAKSVKDPTLRDNRLRKLFNSYLKLLPQFRVLAMEARANVSNFDLSFKVKECRLNTNLCATKN